MDPDHDHAPTGETSTTCYTGNNKCKLVNCTGSCAGQTDTYVKCTSPGGGTPSKQCTSAGSNCVSTSPDCKKNGNAGPAE